MDQAYHKVDIELLIGTVESFYSSRLSPEGMQIVREGVEGIVDALQTLRTVQLTHEDVPFSIAFPDTLNGGRQ